MTKQEITAKIKEAEETLKSLREQLEKPEGLWKPGENEKYYYLTSFEVDYTTFSKHSSGDNVRLKSGNYYPTKEAAQKELDKRIAIQEMREYIAEKGIGWESGAKHFVTFTKPTASCTMNRYDTSFCESCEYQQPDNLYLDSRESTYEFIKDQAENIRKYFGV